MIVESENKYFETPLMAAAISNQPATVEQLLAAGANMRTRGEDGETPLHKAAYIRDSTRVLDLLIDAGLDLTIISLLSYIRFVFANM